METAKERERNGKEYRSTEKHNSSASHRRAPIARRQSVRKKKILRKTITANIYAFSSVQLATKHRKRCFLSSYFLGLSSFVCVCVCYSLVHSFKYRRRRITKKQTGGHKRVNRSNGMHTQKKRRGDDRDENRLSGRVQEKCFSTHASMYQRHRAKQNNDQQRHSIKAMFKVDRNNKRIIETFKQINHLKKTTTTTTKKAFQRICISP